VYRIKDTDENFDQGRMTEVTDRAREITAEFGDRRELIKGISTEVAPQFEDNSFDWVYIDAAGILRVSQHFVLCDVHE
jgi:hypothetical protein